MNAVPIGLRDVADLAAACEEDPLLLWTAQGMDPRVRAWALGEAVAVACPDLNRRDRLTVRGPAAQVRPLAEYALEHLGPSYRMVGSLALVEEVVAASPRLRLLGAFEWMDTHRPPPAPAPVPGRGRIAAGEGDGQRVSWLADDRDEEVAALLARAAPSSWAVPGLAGVRRWAGVRRSPDATVGTVLTGPAAGVTEDAGIAEDATGAGACGDDRGGGVDSGDDGSGYGSRGDGRGGEGGAGAGELVAVAADAWSCPQVGFIAGVATAPPWRGRGHGEAVCRFALTELVAAHGRAALMVDTDNHAAIALYERLGLRRRPLGVAAAEQA